MRWAAVEEGGGERKLVCVVVVCASGCARTAARGLAGSREAALDGCCSLLLPLLPCSGRARKRAAPRLQQRRAACMALTGQRGQRTLRLAAVRGAGHVPQVVTVGVEGDTAGRAGAGQSAQVPRQAACGKASARRSGVRKRERGGLTYRVAVCSWGQSDPRNKAANRMHAESCWQATGMRTTPAPHSSPTQASCAAPQGRHGQRPCAAPRMHQEGATQGERVRHCDSHLPRSAAASPWAPRRA